MEFSSSRPTSMFDWPQVQTHSNTQTHSQSQMTRFAEHRIGRICFRILVIYLKCAILSAPTHMHLEYHRFYCSPRKTK